MPKKIYAVRKGKKIGLFSTWAECESQVKGYSGAEYKSFKTKDEALAYMNAGNQPSIKQTGETMEAYVDGSYEQLYKTYGSGAVILYKDEEVRLKASGKEPSLVDMRNVAGEIIAAKMAMEFALDHDMGELILYHDYEGIAKWCTKAWKANKEGTKAYAAFYDSIKDQLQVKFVKVKAHSGNHYNEIADQLAKEAIRESI